MKNSYKNLLLGGALLLGFQQARGQLVIDGTNFSNFGYVSNRDPYTSVTAAAGSLYTANAGSIFDHNETDPDALRVNNTYDASGSTDNFNGPLGAAGAQTISGSVAPDFSTLVIQNGASSLFHITNTAGANVFTTATFSNGITTTDRANTAAGALRFQNGATYTGGNSDAQHVDGYVGKVGNAAFTFPVGNATTIRTLSITAPASATAQLSTAYQATNVESATSVQAPVVSVFTQGSWDWIAANNADDDNLGVTVSIPDASAFAIPANLRLIGWDGTQWIDLSGGSTASGNTANSTLSGTIPAGVNITQIGIGSIVVPLPVTLTVFNVSKEGTTASLTWATTFETNSDRFEIERSANAKSWAKIGVKTAGGESRAELSYQFTDKTPLDGANYYRLKMIDKDNTFAYSTIRTAEFTLESVVLYPNPTADKLNFKGVDFGSVQRIRVTNLSGAIVYDLAKQNTASLPDQVDIKNFPTGIYFVQLTRSNGTVTIHKILKN